MIINVKVSQKHIDNGLPKSARLCPVALAIKDLLLPYFWEMASIGLKGIFLQNRLFAIVEFPESVRNAIYDYDLYGNMKEFDFDIDIPANARYFFRDDLDG